MRYVGNEGIPEEDGELSIIPGKPRKDRLEYYYEAIYKLAGNFDGYVRLGLAGNVCYGDNQDKYFRLCRVQGDPMIFFGALREWELNYLLSFNGRMNWRSRIFGIYLNTMVKVRSLL